MARSAQSAPISRPLRSLARLVAVSKMDYMTRVADSSVFSDALLKNNVSQHKSLTRKQIVDIAFYIFATENPKKEDAPFSENDLSSFENGRSSLKASDKLFWILRGLGFTREKAERILFLYGHNPVRRVHEGRPENQNLLCTDDRFLQIANYGSLVHEDLYFVYKDREQEREYETPWVTCAIADRGGFQENEIFFRVDNTQEVDLPASLRKASEKRQKEWAEARKANRRAPHNGPTLALADYFVDSTEPEGSGERNVLRLNLLKSVYANNVAAKSSPEAEELKWEHLKNTWSHTEFQPVPYLASGVGIAINVFCDGGERIVLGQRSNLEAFRPSEFDIAVVEGIRPDFNVYDESEEASYIDVHGALWRGLQEELGLTDEDREMSVKDLTIFEFGCDLKFYQWNFMASVTLDLSFDEILLRWKRAKSRRENNFLTSIPANREEAIKFVRQNQMWACGVACLLESIRVHEEGRHIFPEGGV